MNATLTPMKSLSGSFTPAGPAGFSPTFAVEDIDGGHRITITDKNGTQIVDVMDGADGFSTTISVEAITGGHRLTVTDKNGTQTVDIMDGEDGEDGFAPTVTVEAITGGHRLTITDATGTQTVDVMDGQGAVDSVNGKTGAVELALADLSDDETHRTVTDEEKNSWAKKSEIPTVPTQVSAFNNDAGYLTQHQDISGKLDATHATDQDAHSGLFAPADHASQHASGGSDPIAPSSIGAEPAFGVLSFEKGGTGGSNVTEARDNLGVCTATDVASGASVTFNLPGNGTFLFTSSSNAAKLATLFQIAGTNNTPLCTDLSTPSKLTYTTDGNKVTISNASNYTAVICVMSFRTGSMYTGG